MQGVELERREENEGMLPLGWRKKSDGAESEAGETLKAWCLCKGVQFEVTKPNKDSGKYWMFLSVGLTHVPSKP